MYDNIDDDDNDLTQEEKNFQKRRTTSFDYHDYPMSSEAREKTKKNQLSKSQTLKSYTKDDINMKITIKATNNDEDNSVEYEIAKESSIFPESERKEYNDILLGGGFENIEKRGRLAKGTLEKLGIKPMLSMKKYKVNRFVYDGKKDFDRRLNQNLNGLSAVYFGHKVDESESYTPLCYLLNEFSTDNYEALSEYRNIWKDVMMHYVKENDRYNRKITDVSMFRSIQVFDEEVDCILHVLDLNGEEIDDIIAMGLAKELGKDFNEIRSTPDFKEMVQQKALDIKSSKSWKKAFNVKNNNSMTDFFKLPYFMSNQLQVDNILHLMIFIGILGSDVNHTKHELFSHTLDVFQKIYERKGLDESAPILLLTYMITFAMESSNFIVTDQRWEGVKSKRTEIQNSIVEQTGLNYALTLLMCRITKPIKNTTITFKPNVLFGNPKIGDMTSTNSNVKTVVDFYGEWYL